jgi:RNA polymerase sigma factor (sigma-70 family)
LISKGKAMEADPRGSVSHWLSGLRAGDDAAAQELWNRYFTRLVQVAQTRLRHLARESSGEDVALSALKSVMIGVRENRFPDLDDRTSLWPLLVTITARKAISQQRRQLARKRSAANEKPVTEVQAYIGHEPSPEFAVEVADQIEHLVREMNDEVLGTIVQRKLEGYTHEEIADELGCSPRTVIRKLKRIRQEWEEDDPTSAQ